MQARYQEGVVVGMLHCELRRVDQHHWRHEPLFIRQIALYGTRQQFGRVHKVMEGKAYRRAREGRAKEALGVT